MLNEKEKKVPKLRQEVKVKVDIVTSADIKIYYTGKFQDFTARIVIKPNYICPFTKQFPIRTPLKKRPFENIMGKGENTVFQHFLLSSNVFYPSQKEFLF